MNKEQLVVDNWLVVDGWTMGLAVGKKGVKYFVSHEKCPRKSGFDTTVRLEKDAKCINCGHKTPSILFYLYHLMNNKL